jgi:hypothetical protein
MNTVTELMDGRTSNSKHPSAKARHEHPEVAKGINKYVSWFTHML